MHFSKPNPEQSPDTSQRQYKLTWNIHFDKFPHVRKHFSKTSPEQRISRPEMLILVTTLSQNALF